MKIKGMTPARAGIVFTIIIVISIGVSFFVSLLAWRGDSLQLSLFQDLFLSEGIVLVPALLMATVCGAEVGEIFRFKKIKISTCLLTVLFMICMEPLISLVNSISLLFTDNMALKIAEEFITQDTSFISLAVAMAVIGPLAEELAFRGVIYAGLRRSGRLLGAILLQALLFGLMHLNFNQMSYAFVLGVAWGILNEVTGSLWPGLIGHFMINIGGAISGFALVKYFPDALEMEYSANDLLVSIAFNAMLAVLFTGFAVLLLIRIAANEPGGKFRLIRIFRGHDLKVITKDGREELIKRPPVFSVPVVFGIILALVEMIGILVLQMQVS
ncbi:MAG: CPBP family intramembrane metalloprotease [Lachnospiraceae bacterium]|nr:CPBP family intramembrane metalloprotease [Lachnospiraceae bacterium]